MTRTKWPLGRKLSVAIAFGVLSIVSCWGAVLFSAWSDEQARERNCDVIRDALTQYTADLAAVAGAEEGTPEVAELQRRTTAALEDCS